MFLRWWQAGVRAKDDLKLDCIVNSHSFHSVLVLYKTWSNVIWCGFKIKSYILPCIFSQRFFQQTFTLSNLRYFSIQWRNTFSEDLYLLSPLPIQDKSMNWRHREKGKKSKIQMTVAFSRIAIALCLSRKTKEQFPPPFLSFLRSSGGNTDTL